MTIPTELTLESALSDPLILTLMRADRVDPEDVRAAWTKSAAVLRANAEARGRAPEPVPREPSVAAATHRGSSDLVTDCICAAAARAADPSRQTRTGSRAW